MDKFNPIENKSKWFVGGGVLAGLLASLCCIGPLVLTLLGVTGAAVLSKFEFIRVPMIGLVVVLFGSAGYLLFKKRETCEPGSICADPKKYKKMIFAYWFGLVLAVIGITSPAWIGYLF